MTTPPDVLQTPPPALGEAALRDLLAKAWSLTDTQLSRLGSERDMNVLVDSAFVLKISNPAEPTDVIDMEVAALEHIHRICPELHIPATVATGSGAGTIRIQDDDGRECLARLVTVVPGDPLEGRVITGRLAEQVGSLAAMTAVALQGFFHPAGGRTIGWDIRRLPTLAPDTGPLAEIAARVEPALRATAALPSWIQHADITLSNVLANGNGVTGLIDFGDMHHTAAVCDLAVALAAVLRNGASTQPLGTWELASAVLFGYQQHRLLEPAEVDLLGDLVLARLAITAVISADRAARYADNHAYITQYDATNERVLRLLADLPAGTLTAKFGRLAGTSRAPRNLSPIAPGRDGALSSARRSHYGPDTSPAGAEGPASPTTSDAAHGAVAAGGTVPAAAAGAAPAAHRAVAAGGAAPGAAVSPEMLATHRAVAAEGAAAEASPKTPALTETLASSAEGDSAERTEQLLQRRNRAMAGALSPLFYRHPLDIVRGQGPWLFTRDGTRLLDAYNNVAVVGHSHPAVTQSVARQLAVLNTHSRYLHGNVVELAERILATMPPELDTCLFTTSGTEANELAWRLATAYTGGSGALVVRGAYHGSTKWMADLSPNEWPSGYRAAHVATFEAPHGLSGPVRGDSGIKDGAGDTDRNGDKAVGDKAVGANAVGNHAPADNAAEAARRVRAAGDQLLANGDRAALLLADTMFTSEGVLDAPADFLHGLRRGAHDIGALYLADEVQAGYGRSGPQLWRFALAGVVPDMVSLGKPMGAGYPIGALVTRREIAASLAREYEYFSTFAATPVAAAAGLAVLDVLQDNDIPTSAEQVGAYLRAQLRALGVRRLSIGQVRGIGLVAGADLEAPNGAPARAYALDVLNTLVARGVMAGLTGPAGTVLKVRPPLIWQNEHVDLFVDTLDGVLADLEAAQ